MAVVFEGFETCDYYSVTNGGGWPPYYKQQNFDVGTNANRLLLFVVKQGNADISEVTYGGVAMTLVATVNLFKVYRLVNPAAGDNTLRITVQYQYVTWGGYITAWSGVSQTSPLGSLVGVGDNNTGTITTNSTSGGQCLAVVQRGYDWTATGVDSPGILLSIFGPDNMDGQAAARRVGSGEIQFTGFGYPGYDYPGFGVGIPVNAQPEQGLSPPAARRKSNLLLL
jgi:hypothetical protein